MASRNNSRVLRPPQVLSMLLAFVLASVTGGVLMAGLAVPLVTGAGTVTNSTADLFNELPSELEIERPSQQSVMLAADGSVLATFYHENRIVVPLDKISQPMQDAIIAVEDRRFFEHRGVDPEGLARAFVVNFATGGSEGASTLTQQYVKNILIERGRVADDRALIEAATAQTYGRKLQEARYAIALEQKYSKQDILQGYLNIAQFGPSVYGVEAAANHYFSKSAADLTLAEAALLAGIPQAPGKWDPISKPENAQQRRDVVLADMLELGFITQEQHDEAVAVAVPDMLHPQTVRPGCASAGTAAYFCEYVVKEILNDPAYGETVEDRRTLLLRGGLIIETTLDPGRQQAAYDAVVGSVPVTDASGIAMALSSVEPGTGRIQAMAQNTNYGSNPTPEDPRQTVQNYNVDRAHGGGDGFQTGSAFKAIVLAQWLNTGHSLSDVVVGNQRSYPRREWTISCAPENIPVSPYEPKNLEGAGGGRVSVLEATKKSINLPFVEMASKMDLCGIGGLAESMGLKKGTGEPLFISPAMTLGSNEIAPLDMANAFATFANNGTYCTPVSISRVTLRASGEELAVTPTQCKEVLDPEVVRGVNFALQQVVGPGGTAQSAVLAGGRPAAGKTGTANNNYHAWFVGYTPQLAAAVWMGHSQGNISMNYQRINRIYRGQVYGGLIPAPTWKAYMDVATAGLPKVGFDEPSERTIFGQRVTVPSVVGLSIADAQATLEEAGFVVRVGDPIESGEPAGTVGAQSPEGGSALTAGSVVQIRPSTGTPAPADTGNGTAGGDDGGNGQGNGGGNRP